MNLADAPIPAPVSWAKSELETRAEQMVDEQRRHGLASLREALWHEFPHDSDHDINKAALKALGEWR